MKIMHDPPSKVRSRVCELLKKEDKELIVLAYGVKNEDNTVFFIGIACERNAKTPCSYKIIHYNSEVDELWQNGFNESYTYANALIKMGKCIK